MIRRINLYYPKEDNILKCMHTYNQIYAFLNLAGVYVVCKHYDENDKILKQITLLQEQIGIISSKILESKNDCNIYIIPNTSYKESVKKYINKKCTNNEKSINLIIDSDNIENKEPKKLLTVIVNWLLEKKLIDENEMLQLNELCDFYIEKNISLLLQRTKYFSPYTCTNSDLLLSEYENATDELLHILSDKAGEFGDRKYIILQYATLYLAYNTNLYARRLKKSIYDSNDLLEKCKYYIDIKNKYKNAFITLTADILNYLGMEKEAYDYYDMVCKDEIQYNDYAFYMKGLYWRIHGFRDDIASKYFLKSITINPNSYSSWYLFGCTTRDIKDTKKFKNINVANIYNTVNQILIEKIRVNYFNGNEYYVLINSLLKMSIILDDTGYKAQALTALLLIEHIYDNISNNILLDNISNDEHDFKSAFKNSIDISKIYRRIIELYYKVGDYDMCNSYEKNYLKKI